MKKRTVKCGNCSDRENAVHHASSAAVKACYIGAGKTKVSKNEAQRKMAWALKGLTPAEAIVAFEAALSASMNVEEESVAA